MDDSFDYLRDVSLIFDTIAIRKGLQYDKKADKYSSYVDLGGITHILNEKDASEEFQVKDEINISTVFPSNIPHTNELNDKLATEALVFTIVTILFVKKFKVPIAYFL